MGKYTLLGFVRTQWQRLPLQTADLAGQTVVVTGSNIGLGLEAAKHFARMGPKHLVLVCRSQAKGDAAAAEVHAQTGLRPDVELMDMADFASVSAFATAFEQKYERLDVLVCNAAIAVGVYEASKAGWESTIQVNHLSTALVSLLLLPLMTKTARTYNTHPRLVIVSSGVHYWTEVEPAVRATPSILETVSSKAYCVDQGKMADRYNLSKLFNVLFTRGLAAHLPPAGAVVVDTVDPGYCYSSLRRHAPLLQGAAFAVMDLLLARRTDVGARTLVWAVNAGHDDPALRDALKGAYTASCGIEEPSDFVLSSGGQEAEKRLWDETLDVLKKVDPRVEGIVSEYLKA